MQCLVSLISLSLLNVSATLEYIAGRFIPQSGVSYPDLTGDHYVDNDELLTVITNTLLGATAQRIGHASLAILGWSIVGQGFRDVASVLREANPDENSSDGESPARLKSAMKGGRSSRSAPSRAQVLLDAILDVLPGDDPISIMGRIAVDDLQVFEVATAVSDTVLTVFSAPFDLHIAASAKLILLGLLRGALPLVQYGPEIVQGILSTLSYDLPSMKTLLSQSRSPLEPVHTLLVDEDILRPQFLEQIHSRYPHELRPFLACLKALNDCSRPSEEGQSQAVQVLDNMTTFTYTMPYDFNNYEQVREDEIANCIRLTSDLPYLSPPNNKRKMLLLGGSDRRSSGSSDGLYVIPAGTIGVIVNSARPWVVCWHFQHSALEYLGALLSTRTSSSTTVDSTTSQPVDRETASDIVGFITSLLNNSLDEEDLDSAKHALGRLSNGLQRKDDIVRIVSQIFEEELQAQIDQPGLEGSLYLLVSCAQFLIALLPIYPDRVWSHLVRGKLLAIDESSGGLAAIVGATEMPLFQYEFLRSCLRLYEGLINDAVTGAVSRRTNAKALTRFADAGLSSGNTPEKLLSLVLLSFQRIFVDVLQSLPDWKFANSDERFEINTRILRSLENTLKYAYSVDDTSDVSKKLASVFAQPSLAVLDVFLADNPHELTLRPILSIFLTSISDMEGAVTPRGAQAVVAQTKAAVAFCSTALKVGLLTGRKPSNLTSQLLRSMPIITRLYAAQASFKGPIATLLHVLVRSANQSDSNPMSLLGHLGQEATKCFLAVVADLDKPLGCLETEVEVWKMLSAVISNRQQWLAICLLTGSTPRDRLKKSDKPESHSRSKPLLAYALDQLSKIRMLPPARAIAMLEFVALAQNYWSWATNDIKRHPDFIKSITDWLGELAPNARPSDTEEATRSANENQMAAFVADILAMYLHNARSAGDSSLVNTLIPKLQYLRDYGVAVDGYNHSLHKNLAKNFTNKFPNCTLANFKRTPLYDTDFGRKYYYDLELAGKMLNFEPSWSRNRGFVEEIERANVNLSLVESQANLLKSWKAFAIELSSAAADDVVLQKDLAKVIEGCLKANMDASIPAALFDNLSQIRADLAFVLLQRLTGAKSKEPEVRNLLALAWDTVRSSGSDFEVVGEGRDADYYRALLRIVFLALQPQVYNPPAPPTSSDPASSTRKPSAPTPPQCAPLVLEILQKAVATDFRALCSAVHADAASVSPADFVLLTALLQTMLKTPNVQTSSSAQINAIFADAGTLRLAASLYSWSDQLADPATLDPVYGELSILFLRELSSVPLVAEQMAINGILATISSANTSQYLRKQKGKSPFDDPPRVFVIWAKGILPLCLNLLLAVGPPLAAEISAFLNSFPAQLQRAQEALANRSPSLRDPHAGAVTLGLASEAHSLCLIGLIIEEIRRAGASVGVNSEEVPGLEFDRAAVKEEVEGALRARRSLRERITPVGEREAALARQNGGVGSESRLEEMVVSELQDALACLGV